MLFDAGARCSASAKPMVRYSLDRAEKRVRFARDQPPRKQLC
jgi:hypothetical protein